MSSTTIVDVVARRVWDSRGRPTVEADVILSDGTVGRAIAPAGASRGAREAVDLRDAGGPLAGRDVMGAVNNVRGPIADTLRGRAADDQAGADAALIALDATKDKSRLGGNAMVATSLALLHAAAGTQDRPLWVHVAKTYGCPPTIPLPEIQIFGGGAHAGQRVDIQDFMITVPGAESFEEAMEITARVYFAAGDIMAARGQLAGVADEGGWWPVFDSNEAALETLVQAIEAAGEVPGDRVVISLDIAASEFWRDGTYQLGLDGSKLDTGGMIDLLRGWIDRYPIAVIEDPLAEDDRDGMIAFTAEFGDRLQIIGDDYLVTNAELVNKAAADQACNAVLLKMNQAGTVSETLETYRAARNHGFGTIVSARSGETEDVSISHLSAGLGAGQLKVGSFTRSERMAKWNECLRMQEAENMGPFVSGAPLAATWWGKKNLEDRT